MLHTKYKSCVPHGSREKDFLSFFYYNKSMETLDSLGGTSFDTRGLIGRIYVGDHYPLLHTKYISCGARGFREDFLSFSQYKSMGDLCCHGNQSSNLINIETLCSLSPYLMMLYMKFDQNWPTDFSMGVSSKCPKS